MQETWVQSLGQEDPLKKWIAAHSNILAWRISWTEEPGGLQLVGSHRVRHDWTANTCTLHFFIVFPYCITKIFLNPCRLLKNTVLPLCFSQNRPSIFPSIRVFSNQSALRIRWPKYWSFSFSISPSSEYSGLMSFRIDWFDLFAVWGTLKSLLQHNSKAL